jgi:cytochrome oxidase complex assembly protein 1
MNSSSPPSPPAPPTPANYAPAPQFSGIQGAPLRKRRTWVIVLSIIVGVVLLFVLFVAGLAFVLISSMKSSDPYQHAVNVVRRNPQVVAALGTPVAPSWYLLGSINLSGNSGNADLTIPVSGIRQKGSVHVVARKSSGHWTYQTLEFTVDGQEEPVNLLPESTTQPSER